MKKHSKPFALLLCAALTLTPALDEKMERWVYLNDLAEQIEAQKKKG